MDLRTVLAGVLGVGLGLALIVYPAVFVRSHTVGRLPPDRQGEYGSDTVSESRSRRLVQGAGGVTVLVGLYFLAAGLGAI